MALVPNRIDVISRSTIDEIKTKHKVSGVFFASEASLAEIKKIIQEDPISYGDFMAILYKYIIVPIEETDKNIQYVIREKLTRRLGNILTVIDGKKSYVLDLIAKDILNSFDRIRSEEEFIIQEMNSEEVKERFDDPLFVDDVALINVKSSKLSMPDEEFYIRPKPGHKEMYILLHRLGIIDHLNNNWEFTDGGELTSSAQPFARFLAHLTGHHDLTALRDPIRKHHDNGDIYYNKDDKWGKAALETINSFGIREKNNKDRNLS